MKADDALVRAVAEAAPAALVAVDDGGRIVFVNAHAEAMFGYARDELLGRAVEVLLTERATAARPTTRQKGRPRPHETLLAAPGLMGRRRDGSEFPIDVRVGAGRAAEGPFVVASVRDATPPTAQEVDEAAQVRLALERSEARLRSLFEEASDGIFIADLEGRYTDVNPAGCSMLGYAGEEIVGRTIVDLIPPEDVPRLQGAKEELLVPGHIQVADWRLRRKDGSFLAVEVSAKILADGRWQAFVRDISDRKRAEAALSASLERLERAQRIAQVGFWDWDLDANTVERSQQLYALFGLERTPKLEIRKGLLEYIPTEDRAEVLRVIDEAVAARRGYSIEHRIVRADGEERIVRQQGEPVLVGGRPVRMVGTLLDITDLRRAEREREESLRWFEVVFDQCPVGIILMHGVEGESVRLNRHAEALVGRPGGPVSRNPDFVRHADGRPLAYDELPGIRARRGERVDAVELVLCQPSGALVPVLVSAVPLFGSSSVVEGAVVVLQDITTTKELERLRAEWSSIVAHELRAPLNAIALSAQLLLLGIKSPGERREVTNRIRANADRMSRMLGDLMDLSRLDAAGLELSRRSVDLVEVVRASVELSVLGVTDRRIELRAPGEAPRVTGDPDRLAQVMANLLTNAIRYGRAGTPIVVEVAPGRDAVTVAVMNHGDGIPADQVQRLFHRFERADQGHASARGLGLGLHIARGLVEAHGGSLDVESTLGATTTFRFTIPSA